ncbi:MAG: hypothetical protein K6E19_08105 [Lachnospiraceae bacterium]|nr:hypothetical protein [Lachnospiraceae bacterium]
MNKLKLSGKFTIEAAILVPFLMIVTITAISYVIYACDRALLIQDVNAVIADIRGGSNETDLDKHPYLLMEGLDLHVKKENMTLYVEASGKWFSPLWPGLSSVLTRERKCILTTPTRVMRISMDIAEKKKKAEEKNVSD